MSNSVTIREQSNYKFWKISTYLSGILCLMLFLVFWNVTDPFWGGIFRFVSFIFFALSVLGSLKLMNGPLTVIISSSDDHLAISYLKKDKTIHEEQHKRSSIKKIFLSKIEQNIIHSFFYPDSSAMRIDFNDSERDLFLFEFGGRPLFFDSESIKKVRGFLEEKGIDFEL